jgi:hypothetical protein
MLRLKILLAGALISALAGCGSSGSKISASHLDKLVLQRGDLSKAFAPFAFNRQVSADQPAGHSDPARFGREGGWIGRYHRGGSPKTKGPLVIASRVDVFKNASGAKQELAVEQDILLPDGAKKVDVGGLGDQAIGVTTVQSGTIAVRNFAIAWREGNAVAKLELSGFAAGLTRADALALARKQDARLRNALR